MSVSARERLGGDCILDVISWEGLLLPTGVPIAELLLPPLGLAPEPRGKSNEVIERWGSFGRAVSEVDGVLRCVRESVACLRMADGVTVFVPLEGNANVEV
jgi:hypothetical protein